MPININNFNSIRNRLINIHFKKYISVLDEYRLKIVLNNLALVDRDYPPMGMHILFFSPYDQNVLGLFLQFIIILDSYWDMDTSLILVDKFLAIIHSFSSIQLLFCIQWVLLDL